MKKSSMPSFVVIDRGRSIQFPFMLRSL